MKKLQTQHIETLGIREGLNPTAFAEHSDAIFMTSSFCFDSAEQAAARFAGDEEGFIYSRFSNPTVTVFQERLAALEGGEACVATSSGMAAILATCLSILEQGDEILCSHSVFGSTISLFDKYLSRFGITTRYVPLNELSAWDAAVNKNTKMFFVETPSNPTIDMVNIQKLADIAHKNDCLLVVDNCFCTPALQQPIALGADLVIHSATKYLDGQGRALGGAVVGPASIVNDVIFTFLRTAGTSMSPFNAWLFSKGLETLSIRMKAHCEHALAVAQWLEKQPQVEKVYYPGLHSHPHHDLAKQQMSSGFGGMVSFVVKGGRDAAWQLINRTQWLSITSNLGDAKTTITHPASTTHSRLTQEQRDNAGVEEGLIRLSVGLEHPDDIQKDLRF